MITQNKQELSYDEQTDRVISQRQFCKKYGATPGWMNRLEDLKVIKSEPNRKPRETRRYLEKETWNCIVAYMHNPDQEQECAQPNVNSKNQCEKFKLKRRTKHA